MFSEHERMDIVSGYPETSVDLLRTIAGALDVRAVLPRVSEIASRLLPHDALAVGSVDGHGKLALQAATGDLADGLVSPHHLRFGDEVVVSDLRDDALLHAATNELPALLRRGYRSLLTTSTRTTDRVVTAGFWSKHSGAFDRRQLPLARRFVEHIAVAVSHERLARTAHTARLGPGVEMQDEDRRRTSAGNGSVRRSAIVGESAAWQTVLRRAAQVAATETTVLVSGESGTGKEVVARFIHQASARKGGPFVALNCAALPEQLLEAELFGYERGAFTDAQQAKPGQIELARGGVLFLDEVSEMSLSAQAKFLRVLQEREFQRLGGTRLEKAHIRVVAATNRNLRTAVERGAFREDLFYRLQVFDIHIPPLRERPADILPLSDAFLRELGQSFTRPPAGMTREAREVLLQYDWPGNVRELRNALERAAILCKDGPIQARHLSLQSPRTRRPGPPTDLVAMERETIARVLRECRWNKAEAARRLGLSRTQLYGRMRRHSLEGAMPA